MQLVKLKEINDNNVKAYSRGRVLVQYQNDGRIAVTCFYGIGDTKMDATKWTSPLSILDVDTKEYWQSDPLPLLYPDEIGSN